MKSYTHTLKYLYALQSRGMKFGLYNIKVLLKSVGNPERKFPSIHIAGTNGKGSTASFLASVFMESGYTTALYTSPHLVNFTERIRVNGREMPEARLVHYAQRLRPTIEKLNATFFEATTCIAFQYFADEKVEIAVIEAGLGGRLDSTNVVRPLVSVITNISYDHMEYLGNTLKKIAREKGGIIKRDIPCVTATDNPDVAGVLRRIAHRKGAQLLHAHREVLVKPTKRRNGQFILSLTSRKFSIRRVRLGLPGVHQVNNAAAACAALDVLLRRSANASRFAHITNSNLLKGLERVRENTGLRGRLERVGSRFIVDVAHNVDGIKSLASSLPESSVSNRIVVFGVMKDKEYHAMCEIVARLGKTIVAVHAKNSRTLRSSEIVRHLKLLGKTVIDGKSVHSGIGIAKKLSRGNGEILITGSHYVVGEALKVLRQDRSIRSKL